MVVIVGYYLFMPKPAPTLPKAIETAQPNPAQTPPVDSGDSQVLDIGSLVEQEQTQKTSSATVLPPVETDRSDIEERTITLDSDLFTATFSNKGAALTSFVLKHYRDEKKQPLDLISERSRQSTLYPLHFFPFGNDPIFHYINSQKFVYAGESTIKLADGKATLVFEFANIEKNLKVQKSFTFNAGTYLIDLSFSIIKEGISIANIPVVFGPGLESNFEAGQSQIQTLKIAAFNGTNIKKIDITRKKIEADPQGRIEKKREALGSGQLWTAFETVFFASIFRTDVNDDPYYFLIRSVGAETSATPYRYLVVASPRQMFLGPKDDHILTTISSQFPQANRLVEYGDWIGWIVRFFLRSLLKINELIGNFGWSIIILTLFLKLILFLPTYSSSKSMAKMQAVQPKIKAIRNKYKNVRDMEQRRRMNQEIMELYKSEKINPAGGCLPLLIQLPVFFAFWRMLTLSISLRQQPWIFWITDLSKKDPIYLLPILGTLTQFILQKMTPSGADDTQKKMMYLMPFLMLFIFLNLPSGVNLYFAFSNVLQIAQQKLINDKIYKERKQEDRQKRILKKKGRG